MHRLSRLSLTTAAAGLAAIVLAGPSSASASGAAPFHAMGTLKAAKAARPFHSSNLSYHGGSVQTAPKVFLVFWGSQWGTNGSNDPSGEVGLVTSFIKGIGGNSWSATNTQYCQGVTSGTSVTPCGTTSNRAGNQSNEYVNTWFDSGSAAPSSPSQSQLAAEAAKAANQFGSSTQEQFVVATASGDSQTGFGTQWCAYHSSTSANSGSISWTYLPYITDAGASCGADFNGLGPYAGITIVEGHEYAESVTDPFPSSGWVDSRGSEIGDKCAWISSGQGASADVALSNGTYPVQSLWSNAFNGGAGGCVLSYP